MPPRPYRGAASSRCIPGSRSSRAGRRAIPATRWSGSGSRTARLRSASTAWGRTISGSARGPSCCSTGAAPTPTRSSTRSAPRSRAIPIRTPIAPGPGRTATPSPPTSRARCPNWVSACRRMRSARIFCRAGRWSRGRRAAPGFQLSLYGIAGILVAAKEGVELNVLGLSIGIDAAAPGLKLPAIGRLGLPTRIVGTSSAAP